MDVNTDTVIDLDSKRDGTQGIVLQASNPFGGQVRVGAKLYLSCVGGLARWMEASRCWTFRTTGRRGFC